MLTGFFHIFNLFNLFARMSIKAVLVYFQLNIEYYLTNSYLVLLHNTYLKKLVQLLLGINI